MVIVRETPPKDDAKKLTVQTLQCDGFKLINVKSKKCHVYNDSQFKYRDKLVALLKHRFDKFDIRVVKQGDARKYGLVREEAEAITSSSILVGKQ